MYLASTVCSPEPQVAQKHQGINVSETILKNECWALVDKYLESLILHYDSEMCSTRFPKRFPMWLNTSCPHQQLTHKYPSLAFLIFCFTCPLPQSAFWHHLPNNLLAINPFLKIYIWGTKTETTSVEIFFISAAQRQNLKDAYLMWNIFSLTTKPHNVI